MAAPVWVLSVDLQTKTATFQSGMAEAAKTARSSFNEIKSGANTMGREVGGASGSARQAVMLLGDEFGVHLPRGLTTFIASLGPVGAAMEAAFPFVAIILGATLLIEHLVKMHDEGVKLTQDQIKFGTAVQVAFNSLDQKLLQAGIRSDELKNDHIGALKKTLELIDKQSLAELAQQFGVVQKAADTVFADISSHWYTFGIGSKGAKHALDEFQAKYESLLAQGKQSEASDLLKGTRESAERVLALQKEAEASEKRMASTAVGFTNPSAVRENTAAVNELKKSGVSYTQKEVAAQQTLVDALQAQSSIEAKIAALKKQDDANAKTSTAKEGAAQSSAAGKAAAESQLRIAQLLIQGDRATAESRLTISRASIAEREQIELGFAQRELDIEQTANKAQIAALDKMAADYPNALKALHEKAEELEAQHGAKVAEITSKAATEQSAQTLADIEQGVRAAIEATQQGTAERIAAIDAGLKKEASLNMQDLSTYRDLQTQRVQAAREMAEEQAKLEAEAGRESADNAQKMGELALAAEKQHQAMLDSARHVNSAQRIAEEITWANEEYALKMKVAKQQEQSLDKSGKEYTNKLKEIQDKQKQLTQEHENELTAIKEKAEEARNTRILSADDRFNGAIAAGLTQTLMGHKSFAATMTSLGNQVASGMIENAIKSMLAADMTKEKDAAAAARKAYLIGSSIGGPAGIVLGPVMAAAAFTEVMAFADGGVVPGMGHGDSVPAMLTPGEGIIPGSTMGQLDELARSGRLGGATHYHVQPRITIHASALDADGMDSVLAKNASKIQKHVEHAMRKMNR